LSPKDIVVKYNNTIYNILKYYKFVHNYRKIAVMIEYLLKSSCAKLLATKYKLKTQAKVFQKYGKNLNVSTETKFVKPS
jgi:hypothetical protein